MEAWFLGAGIALTLFSLWVIARHDWLRLSQPSRRAMARVSGHRSTWEDGSKSFAAIFRFSDETGAHEVVDALLSAAPKPPVGTLVELTYPEGRPDLARPPRLLLWSAIYLFLLALLGLLGAKALGWLEG